MEIEQAQAWLAQNPNDPRAAAIKAKIASAPAPVAVDDQAKMWAEQNPDDPRSAQIMQKISSNTDRVVDEAHPAVAWKDRALVKNFGNDTGMAYMQEKYPNLQFKPDGSNLLIKGKNETEWRKLDPSSFELSDISDVAYDIGSGVVEGGAAAAGALLGNVPGMMAGAGVAGAASEGIRQGIGKLLGVNKEVSGTDVLATGVASGLLAPVFGAGKVSKGLRGSLSNMAGKVSGDAAEKIATKEASSLAERGLLGAGYDQFKNKFAPGIASLTSGEKASVYKTYINNLDEIENMTDDVVQERAVGLFTGVEEALQQEKREVGDIFNKVRGTDAGIDISDIKADFTSKINSLKEKQSSEGLKAWEKKYLATLKSDFNDMFVRETTGVAEDGTETILRKQIGDVVPVNEAMEIKRNLNEISQYRSAYKELDAVAVGEIKKTGGSAYGKLNKNIEDVFEQIPEANAKYREIKQMEGFLDKLKTKTGKDSSEFGPKALDVLLSTDSKTASKIFRNNKVQEIAQRYGIDVENEARKIEAYVRLKKPSLMPVSNTGSNTPRGLIASGAGAAGAAALGDARGDSGIAGSIAVGGTLGLLALSPKAWKTYLKQGVKGEQFLKKQFQKMGQQAPKDLKQYFNKQMAAQGMWNTMRSREENK